MNEEYHQMEEYQEDEYWDQPSNGENNLLTRVEGITDALSATMDNVQRVAALYAEVRQVEEKTKQVQAWSSAQITQIVAKYKSCQEFMLYTFSERDKALAKHYELLDRAVAGNDKELIVAALQGISGIITKSPLEDLEKLAKLYDDTSQPLLDF